jgi:ArsR family transcriptional regulator
MKHCRLSFEYMEVTPMPERGQIVCDCGTETACCVSLLADPIDEDVSDDLAIGFKALGDPHRVAVIHMLAGAPGPVCVVDIERHLPLSQSTVSYHLKTLLDAGVIDRERRGRWSYYTIRPERLDQLSRALADHAVQAAQSVQSTPA